MVAIPIEFPIDWSDYELLDSGDGKKLERFGPEDRGYTIVRPEPRNIWAPSRPEQWSDADAIYNRSGPDTGSWTIKSPPPDPWHIHYKNLTFALRPTEFKHTGVFPEQAVNWNWLTALIGAQPMKILNLFAYTGGSTMAAMSAGAQVTHVDSVKNSITWARDNIGLSKLDSTKVRYIEDDAAKFVLREQRRGQSYDGIIMDPPRFGRGPKGEVWKLAEDLPKLLNAAVALLSEHARFLLLNAYTADLSALAVRNLVADAVKSKQGTVTFGELALEENADKRLVPQGIFVRWTKI